MHTNAPVISLLQSQIQTYGLSGGSRIYEKCDYNDTVESRASTRTNELKAQAIGWAKLMGWENAIHTPGKGESPSCTEVPQIVKRRTNHSLEKQATNVNDYAISLSVCL